MSTPKKAGGAPEITSEFDPATGEMVPVVPEHVVAEQEKLSFFEDDEGEQLYSRVVVLDGLKVRVRELCKSELTEYNRLEMKVANCIQSLATVQGEQATRALEELPRLQAAAHDYVVGCAVTGWELKRPDGKPVACSPEMKKKLRPTRKADLCDRIVQISQMGRELSGFLAG